MNYIAKNTSLQLGTQAVIDEQRNFVTTAILLHISALWFSHIASILADSCVNRASCINIVRCLHSIWACLATVCVIVLYRLPDKLCGVVVGRDDHYPVAGWISRRIVSLQPDTDIQNLLSIGNRIRISETLLSIFRGFRLLEKVVHCTIIYLLFSEASFQPSVP